MHAMVEFIKAAALNQDVVLKEHQAQARDRIVGGEDGQLLYHGTGTGKSLSSLAGIEALPEASVNAVMPAGLRINYRKELNRYVTPDSRSRYQISSYDKARNGLPDSDVLVADEVQRLRNQGSSYKGVLDAASHAQKRVLLSATPLVNTPGDLASVVNLLHGRQIYTPDEFEKDFVDERVVRPWFGLVRPRVVTSIANRKKLQRLLEGRVHYVGGQEMSKDQPTSNAQTVNVEMGRTQDAINRLAQGRMPALLRWQVRRNLPPNKRQATQLNAFMSGMRQVGLSPAGFDQRLSTLDAFNESPKLKAVLADLKAEISKPHGKTMAFSNYIDAGLLPLAAGLNKAKIPYSMVHGGMTDSDRKRQVDDFNNDKVRTILLGPAASEGLSLKGTSLAQVLDPHWNQARLDQAKARAIRMDSHTHLPAGLRNVNIRQYVSQPRRGLLRRVLGLKPAVGSDEYLYSRAAEKQQRLDVFNDFLKTMGQ